MDVFTASRHYQDDRGPRYFSSYQNGLEISKHKQTGQCKHSRDQDEIFSLISSLCRALLGLILIYKSSPAPCSPCFECPGRDKLEVLKTCHLLFTTCKYFFSPVTVLSSPGSPANILPANHLHVVQKESYLGNISLSFNQKY